MMNKESKERAMRRMTAVMLCMTLIIAVLAGCRSSTVSSPQMKKSGDEKKITCAISAEPVTLDPAMSSYSTSSSVIQNLFTGLYQIDESGELIPGCAKEVKISEDGLVYTFFLREGLKWSDGSDLTAGDFEYAWKRILDTETASPIAWYLYYLKNGEAYHTGTAEAEDVGVKALDTRTLEVTLENPVVYFLTLTATTSFFPVKKEAVEGKAVWTKSARTYVSNGAFRMQEINPQENYLLVKNPFYVFADTVQVNEISLVFIEFPEAALTAFNTGEVDILDGQCVGEQAIFQYQDREELLYFDVIGTVYYDFNCSKEYLSDARVRKALSMAIDRDLLIQNLVSSKPQPATGYVPYGIPYGTTGQDFRDVAGNLIAEDVKQAKALLAEAGYSEGEGFPTLTIITQSSAEEQKNIVQALQSMWKENLGIQVSIVTYEPKVYWLEHSAGNFDIAYDGWTGDYLDPSTNLDCFLASRVKDENRWNGEPAKQYDRLMQKSRTIEDTKERMKLFLKAERILLEEMPVMPLYFRNAALLVNKRCKNIIKNYAGHTMFRYAKVE